MTKQPNNTCGPMTNDSKAIARLVRQTGAAIFARNLIDQLRDIAECDADADTCSNESCHVANAIERGLDEAANTLTSLSRKRSD